MSVSAPEAIPSLSTDQIAAFVELVNRGSLRAAAESLFVTEQGLRNRLITLERRLGAELYVKARGPRRRSPLTAAGRRFLPAALAFLEQARQLTGVIGQGAVPSTIHVAATQYLILYVLIDVVRRFHRGFPDIRVRLSNRLEREIEEELLGTSDVELGVAAPYEASPALDYTHLFSMNWSLVAPPQHPLLRKRTLGLADLADEPLIVFERGSTGRQHVIDAFHGERLSPRIETETSNTEIIVRMVEAGLGIAIVPLIAGGAVTRGRKVGIRSLGDRIRPIHSGILTRRGETLSGAGRHLVEFLKRRFAAGRRPSI